MATATEKVWVVRSLREVAEFFDVSPGTVRSDWRGSGMPGRNGAWDLREILRWRDSRRRDPSAVQANGAST
ncbi:MAG TPA: hypothetical protein VG713_12425, partial [Pirellulales bacterium]|nr:hypothetical protein [Pirellulales bacterium]